MSPKEITLFEADITQLGGRSYFPPGRPLRFEIDGIALLGVALGVRSLNLAGGASWLTALLTRSSTELKNDEWQLGLVQGARIAIGDDTIRVTPEDLAVAFHSRGLGDLAPTNLEIAWQLISEFTNQQLDQSRIAVRLAAFDSILSRTGQIAISGNTKDDLGRLLENVSRSMRLWRYEAVKRTAKSEIAVWTIDNEYHVQALLWVILAPLFADLEDEENLPSVGHKNPRADLGIPSLRTIIEVKFMRASGQKACAKIIEEIAADASLYLSTRDSGYDNIIAFIWDDCAQTEQYHELKMGLENIRSISKAIIIPRPASMKRE